MWIHPRRICCVASQILFITVHDDVHNEIQRREIVITVWAVALRCYISHSAIHRKRQISTPQGALTLEPVLMKLGMVDCVRDPTPHDSFGLGSSTWVVWAHT